METPHALVFGEALIDLVERAGDDPVAVVGGSPLNVAVGLSRLGVRTALRTHVGTDEYGAMIRRHLQGNDVAVTPGSVHPGRTSTARAAIGADGSAEYVFDVEWAPGPAPEPEPAPVLVHTGSIAATLDPGDKVVGDALAELRSVATISYDPNVRPALMGDRATARARIEAIIRAADVVKASDEDLAWLYPGIDPTTVVRRWRELGPSVVVVTRGELGAHAVTRDLAVDVDAPQVAVIDTIGAGDSFMAGLLAGLAEQGLLGRVAADALGAIDADALRSVLEHAAACAAITVSRRGADPPSRDAVRAALGALDL